MKGFAVFMFVVLALSAPAFAQCSGGTCGPVRRAAAAVVKRAPLRAAAAVWRERQPLRTNARRVWALRPGLIFRRG